MLQVVLHYAPLIPEYTVTFGSNDVEIRIKELLPYLPDLSVE